MQRIEAGRLPTSWQQRLTILGSLMAFGLSLAGGWSTPVTATEVRVTPPASESPPASGASQERFLQHFISRSLAQKAAEEREAAASASAAAAPPSQRVETPTIAREPAVAAPQMDASLSSTVTTMVLSLGAILGCLLIAAYVMRRYLFSSAAFGKRATSLRVLARTHLTPKAVVALLEVPGKTLVIGVTGSTLVTLGEVVMDTERKEAPPSTANGTSFAMALEQSADGLNAAEPGDETLWQVSERIQRKVSRLKQL